MTVDVLRESRLAGLHRFAINRHNVFTTQSLVLVGFDLIPPTCSADLAIALVWSNNANINPSSKTLLFG